MIRPLIAHIVLASVLLFFVQPALCAKKTRKYVTLHYANQELLRDFNDELRIGRSLSRMIASKRIVTVEDEVLAKINIIAEKATTILNMYPDKLHFNVVLLPEVSDVARVFKQRYGKSARHIAYYSLSEKTIYISVDDTNIRVLSHEIGHAIVDHYFKVRPPYNIHELMAQFTEKHITD